MMPMFTKLFAINMEASNVLGVSSRLTILLYEGCCLVLSILISFRVNEKKATSDPASKNDIKKSIMTTKKSIVIAAGVGFIASKLK